MWLLTKMFVGLALFMNPFVTNVANAAAVQLTTPPSVNGCATQLQIAAFEWFYSIQGSSLDYSSRSLATFMDSLCNIPYNNVTNALNVNYTTDTDYRIAASVLSPESALYGAWVPPNSFISSPDTLNYLIAAESTTPNIVKDFATAVCRNLPVAYLLNANIDSLHLSPVLAKLTGSGIQSSNVYNGCLALENVGIFFDQTTAIGSLPLNITVSYAENMQNPSYGHLTGFRWVPGNSTVTPKCLFPPVCKIYQGTKDMTSSWMNNGIDSIALPIDAATTYTISCMPDAACMNDGLYEDIYFTTFVATDLNPWGSSTSYFAVVFNRARFQSPPPSPPPPSPRPPSPSPPSPRPPLPICPIRCVTNCLTPFSL